MAPSATRERAAPSRASPVRVVVSKVGLDGHERGAKVIAHGLRDAGMEVIYAGLRRTPEELTSIVIEEDARVLGLSILSGAVVPLTRGVLEELSAQGVDDVVVLVGGIVSAKEAEVLHGLGVAGVFGPGASMTEVVDCISARLAPAAPA